METYKIQANASGTRNIAVTEEHLNTIKKYSLLKNLIDSNIIYIHIAKIEIVINTQINYQKIRSSCISQLYALTSSKSDFFSCLTIKFRKG